MLYLLIPVIIFITDYVIKAYIEKNYKKGDSKEILSGRIIIHKYHNEGAMLNALDKNQRLVTVIAGGMTLGVFIGYLLLFRKKGMYLLKTGVSLVLGGALNNLYDRIKRKYVVDYFSFQSRWKKFRQIVFNISDICIFLGSFLFILWNLKNKS